MNAVTDGGATRKAVLRPTKVARQRTLKNAVNCIGIGLHSGVRVAMTLRPAAADTGIVFVRTDLGGASIPANYDRVCDTRLGTTVRGDNGVSVATVEHLMAALWGCGIDNLYVELDGPEVPVMDGSAAPFVFLVECAGQIEQDSPRHALRVRKTVSVEGQGGRLSIQPADGFSVSFEIEFPQSAVASQTFWFGDRDGAFKADLSRARTFGFFEDVSALQAAGLALGGSLDNAVVVHRDQVLNEEGLRYANEFVRHKVLDCIGDLYLSGAMIMGHVTAVRSGHDLNNQLLHALFADETNFRHGFGVPRRTVPRSSEAVSAIG